MMIKLFVSHSSQSTVHICSRVTSTVWVSIVCCGSQVMAVVPMQILFLIVTDTVMLPNLFVLTLCMVSLLLVPS